MRRQTRIMSALFLAGMVALPFHSAQATMYVIGDSYSANGADGAIPGDTRYTNGNVWVENLAVVLNQPKPITSSAAPASTDETATNFARGGARALASTGTGGVDRPKNGSEQMEELGAYLKSGIAGASDTFVIWLGGNDILEPYGATLTLADPSYAGLVTPLYIDSVVAEVERLVTAAITDSGFKSVVMPNGVAHEGLPLYQAMPADLKLLFGEDVAYLNTRMEERIAALKSAHPDVAFYTANWNSLFRMAAYHPADYGFVDATSTIEGGADPATAMWFDGTVHPSAKMHQLMSEAVASPAASCVATSVSSEESGGGGIFGLVELLFFFFAAGSALRARGKGERG